MYKVFFYKKRNGESPVADYIEGLRKENSKDSRINYKKILTCLNLLKEKGLGLGMPYIRRIEDDIWEIRVNKNRILFFPYDDGFVLLHWFNKRTKKTPESEKIIARKEKKNYILGGGNNEE